MTIEWIDIFKISASSSLLTGLISWGLNHLFVHRPGLRRDARYLAQRLAIILERFAVDCAEFIADNDLVKSSDGHAGQRHLTLPSIGPFPTEADWKAIAPDLMDRVLSLPSELTVADKRIAFWWDVAGDEEAMESETDLQAGRHGLRAWILAADLRRRYKIPASTLPQFNWDFVATLQEKSNRAEALSKHSDNASSDENRR